MAETAANAAAPRIEDWTQAPWRKLEQHVFRLQKRIYRAQARGNTKAVHSLQRLLMKSEAARMLAVRRVTQDNQGKKTAGIDGVKAVGPAVRLLFVERLRTPEAITAQPVRRVCIPKPGKPHESRPLGIPVLLDRAHQALAKLVLEPQWEARFEPDSYGFRPGRSCHDAIEALFKHVVFAPKYVLDADIKGCFDNIDATALLAKLDTIPALRRAIRAWLHAGVLDEGRVSPTTRGVPQGGVLTPPTIWQNGRSSSLYPCHGRGCVRAMAKGSRVHRCKALVPRRAVRRQVGEGNMSRRADRERPNHAPTNGRPPRIVVRVTFEASYTAAACLAEAYEQLVPTLRRLLPQGNGQPLGLPAEPLSQLRAGARREGRR